MNSPLFLSKRILDLSPSATLAIDAKVKKLESEGRKIINLSLGEPDFDTPKNIQKQAISAVRSGYTHYTQTAGILELRKEISKKLKKENNINYDPSEIVVGVGSKQLLYNCIQVICDPKDEVIIPTPTWSTYVEQVRLSQGVPVLVKMDPPFSLTLNHLKKVFSKKTKAIILNSPSNPTGALIENSELKKIAEFAVKNNIIIISDEIYEKLLYGKTKYLSAAAISEKVKEITVTINGFSKSYAMTGWRIGYAAGPKEIIKAMTDLQSQTTSNTSSIAQYAGIEALKGSQASINKMRKVFAKRREFVIKSFKKFKNIQIFEPEGAFYLFFSIEKMLNKEIASSANWCGKLIDEYGVALVPGEAFLYPGWVRMSFAASDKELEKAVVMIDKFINNL